MPTAFFQGYTTNEIIKSLLETKAVHYCNDKTIDQNNQLMRYTKQKQSINAIIANIEPHTQKHINYCFILTIID